LSKFSGSWLGQAGEVTQNQTFQALSEKPLFGNLPKTEIHPHGSECIDLLATPGI
jgi:hypothetical protein